MTESTYDSIVSQGKYIFIEVYGKQCIWCYRILGELNTLFDYMMTNRKDILFAKVDGNENYEMLRRFKVQSYPTLLLIRPNESRYGLKYDGERTFEDMKQFLNSFHPLEEKIQEELTPAAMQTLCKPHVDQALEVFENDIRKSGLLLSKDNLRYYTSVAQGVRELAKTDKNAQILIDKLKPLELQAGNAERQDLKEFDEFRKDVIQETSNQFVQISEKIATKIADIEALLDTRILQKRNQANQNGAYSKETEGQKNSALGVKIGHGGHTDAHSSGEQHTQTQPVKSPQENDSEDSFAYSYVIKYAICVIGGMVSMLLYQRLNRLDDIIKQAHE